MDSIGDGANEELIDDRQPNNPATRTLSAIASMIVTPIETPFTTCLAKETPFLEETRDPMLAMQCLRNAHSEISHRESHSVHLWFSF